MKTATFVVAAVAVLSLAAASANAASPSLGIGSPSLSAPLPNEIKSGRDRRLPTVAGFDPEWGPRRWTELYAV